MSSFDSMSSAAVAEALGQRLKRVRLNQNLSQQQVADTAGLSRRAVANAENTGAMNLETFIAVLYALGRVSELDNFLAEEPLSPAELYKLRGKERQRASGKEQIGKTSTPHRISHKDAEW